MTQYVNSVDGMADYTSDATGQLTAADYNYQDDKSYQYDDNGNRVLANGQSYTTGSNNRLLSDGMYRYLCDAEGNRTHWFIDVNQNGQLDQGDTDITQYNWDHRNRLVKVEHLADYAALLARTVHVPAPGMRGLPSAVGEAGGLQRARPIRWYLCDAR